MKQIDFFNIKFNHIQIFLTSAQTQSFSKAAEKLNVTQPMVSKTIQILEKELGLILFIRDKGRIRLTPAGRELYVQWKNLLHFFENSIQDASAQQEGLVNRFVLGTSLLMPEEHMLLIREASKQFPDNVTIHYASYPQSTAWDMLKREELDLIVVSGHILPELRPDSTDWCILQKTNLAIFISLENPLSKRKVLTFTDLREEPFIVFSSDKDTRYMQLLNRLSQEAGFSPRISGYISDEASFAINLFTNSGVILGDTSMRMDPKAAKRFPLAGTENHLYLVWRIPQNTQRKEALKKITDVIIQIFHRTYDKTL